MLTYVQYLSNPPEVLDYYYDVTFANTGTPGTAGNRLKASIAANGTSMMGMVALDGRHCFRVGKPIKVLRTLVFDVNWWNTPGYPRDADSIIMFYTNIEGVSVAYVMKWLSGGSTELPEYVHLMYTADSNTLLDTSILTSHPLISSGSFPNRQNVLKFGFSVAKDGAGSYVVFPVFNLNNVEYNFHASATPVSTLSEEYFTTPTLHTIFQTLSGSISRPAISLGAWD